MARHCVFCILCVLALQTMGAAGTYRAWFTDATITGSTKLSKPTGAPDPAPGGTKGACFDMRSLTQGYALRVPSMGNTTRGMISFWIRPNLAGVYTPDGNKNNEDPYSPMQERSAPPGSPASAVATNNSGGYSPLQVRPSPPTKPWTSWQVKYDHVLMTAGDPASDGFEIVWNNWTGVLRFTMAGKNGAAIKVTTVRADISSWQAQDWRHVQVAWTDMYGNGQPVGLAIWIDRVAVASCIFGGPKFMTAPSGYYVTIGDKTSCACIDELIFRGDSYPIDAGDTGNSMNTWCTRDFYRTAPYTAIQINHMPNKVNSDPWVLVGKKKQFGITGTRLLNVRTGATTTDYLTNFDKRYGPEADFDAKPYINWASSNISYASVDANGLVTGKLATASPINLTAYFAGLTAAAYPLEVRAWDGADAKPDLGIMYVERTPRYRRDASKKWPNPGDTVTTRVYFGNWGTVTASNFKVKIERATDTNNDFKINGETWTTLKEQTITSLAAGSTTSVSQTWTWPSTNPLSTGSVWIRVTLDSGNTLTEICEANNQRCEKSNAKSFQWAYRASQFSGDYSNGVVNLVGSFSDYDWYNAETDRISKLMRDTVLSTTSANGILDSIRVDKFTPWLDLPNRDDEQSLRDVQYFDGHFDPWGEDGVTPMDFDNAVGHEIGHTTLGLPDLYGQSTDTDNLFVRKADGSYYGANAIYPITRTWDHEAMYSSVTFDHPDECGVGYDLIMSGCHFGQLGLMCAGLVHYNRQTRNDLGDYWGGLFEAYIPTTTRLQLYDANDLPLKNARVYIYQITCTGEWYQYGNRYYSDRYKFTGVTNASGVFTIPTVTSTYWDDWNTDSIDGAVSAPHPFHTASGNVQIPTGAQGDVLLLRVVGSGGKVEFHLMPLTEFNTAYLSGITDTFTYTIRTSLASPTSALAAVAPIDPPGGLRPVARVRYNGVTYSITPEWWIPDLELTVSAGAVLTLDGSVSMDPEGFSPLRYRWDGAAGRSASSSYVFNTSGYGAGDYEIYLTVIDSVRYSERFTVVVHVQ